MPEGVGYDFKTALGLGASEDAGDLGATDVMDDDTEELDPLVEAVAEEAIGAIRAGDTKEAARSLVELIRSLRE